MGGNASQSIKAIVVGLDNSGKSTIINHMRPSDVYKNSSYIDLPYVCFFTSVQVK